MLTKKYALKAIDDIKKMFGQKRAMSNNTQVYSPKPQEERYDRMNRKDFSRKTNSFVPVLVNDGYSNFRFSKRAGEVLSPLSKSKFGFTLQKSNARKMSLMSSNILRSDGNASKAIRSPDGGALASDRGGHRPQKGGFARLGQKSMRHNSVAVDNVGSSK